MGVGGQLERRRVEDGTLKGNSGVKMNFFHLKGLIFPLRFLLVVLKNCVRDFRISMLK